MQKGKKKDYKRGEGLKVGESSHSRRPSESFVWGFQITAPELTRVKQQRASFYRKQKKILICSLLIVAVS